MGGTGDAGTDGGAATVDRRISLSISSPAETGQTEPEMSGVGARPELASDR